MRKIVWSILFLWMVMGCTVTEKSQRGLKYSVQAGLNKGGITENTDLTIVPNAQATPESTVDAFSGATRLGGNVGFHVSKPLRYGQLESGVDYMYNHQTFSFADQGNMLIGVRQFHVNQLMLPLTYNFVLFKRLLPASELQLRVGYLGQLNLISTTGIGMLPVYSLKTWSNGATLGLSAHLIQFGNGSKLGLFVDGYRGSRIYTDHYNQESFEMPGSSFVKFGFKYQFPNR